MLRETRIVASQTVHLIGQRLLTVGVSTILSNGSSPDPVIGGFLLDHVSRVGFLEINFVAGLDTKCLAHVLWDRYLPLVVALGIRGNTVRVLPKKNYGGPISAAESFFSIPAIEVDLEAESRWFGTERPSSVENY